MRDTSRMTAQKTWQPGRRRVSVLAEMALRREKVTERLRELRERHALTQEQAAARVGVNLRQWQRWEAGESMPYPRNLDAIASRFGISVEEFFDPEPLPRSDGQLDRIEAKLDMLLRRLDADDHLDLAGALSSLDAEDPDHTAPEVPASQQARARRRRNPQAA